MNAATTLLFDADDTLWENNVLFERVIDTYIAETIPHGMSRGQARVILDRIEHANSVRHGYGCTVFEQSLHEFHGRLHGTEPGPGVRDRIRRLCAPIRESRIELLDGVEETLRELSARHRLFLVTKGARQEQRRKIDHSGLAPFFTDTVIVREKDERTYLDLVASWELDSVSTWMIGNSPRSDILPALSVGLGAVLVPHPLTWALEHSDVPETGPRFLRIETFAQLTGIF